MNNVTQRSLKAVALSTLAVGLVVSTLDCPSWAGRFAQNHPRRAEVLRNDRGIGNQLNQDRGHLGGNYGQLRSEQQGIRQQEQQESRANGGYITQGQQRHLNKEETGLQNQMNQDYRGSAQPGSFASNHPRRSQVINSDANMQNQINGDRGQLGGNYGQLSRQDGNIYHEEQRDARQNGGYITQQQQQHIDNQENRLQNQINQDHQ